MQDTGSDGHRLDDRRALRRPRPRAVAAGRGGHRPDRSHDADLRRRVRCPRALRRRELRPFARRRDPGLDRSPTIEVPRGILSPAASCTSERPRTVGDLEAEALLVHRGEASLRSSALLRGTSRRADDARRSSRDAPFRRATWFEPGSGRTRSSRRARLGERAYRVLRRRRAWLGARPAERLGGGVSGADPAGSECRAGDARHRGARRRACRCSPCDPPSDSQGFVGMDVRRGTILAASRDPGRPLGRYSPSARRPPRRTRSPASRGRRSRARGGRRAGS